jgi:hypothetical protein
MHHQIFDRGRDHDGTEHQDNTPCGACDHWFAVHVDWTEHGHIAEENIADLIYKNQVYRSAASNTSLDKKKAGRCDQSDYACEQESENGDTEGIKQSNVQILDEEPASDPHPGAV